MNKLIVASLMCCVSVTSYALVPADAKFAGNCALTMANEGKSVPTDCSITWQAPNKTGTYCLGNQEALTAWNKDPLINMQKAEMVNAKNLQNNAMNNANQMINNANQAMDNAMKQMEQVKKK